MATTRSKKALLILAEGAEEMETVIPVDVLRRGGVRVTLAGLAGPGEVKCSRGVVLKPDTSLDRALAEGECYDLLILPGGLEGAKALANSPRVLELVAQRDRQGELIGAICAGPTVLAAAGILAGRSFTCHPAAREGLAGSGEHRDEPVVRDGNLVTSQGPGTSFAFALTMLAALLGKEAAARVAGPMLVAGW